MPRSSAIAKSALFFSLRRNKSGGGSDPGTPGQTPYEYLVSNGGYSNTEANFIKDWKTSLSRKPFAEEFADYLTSIGYTSSMSQANSWLLKLVNGELLVSDNQFDIYKYIQSLGVDPEVATKINIDSKFKQLVEGTLTMNEFYLMLVVQGYKPTQDEMRQKIYEVLTTEYATKEDLDNIKPGVTPFDYAVELGFNKDNKEEFDKNYMIMAEGNYIYSYAQSLLPGITKQNVDKIMLDLLSGKLYNKSFYDMMADEYDYEGTEEDCKYWMLQLLNGMLKSMDPYEYSVSLGDTQTREEFNQYYNLLLANHTIDGGGDNTYPGDWEIPDPIVPETFNLYKFYQSIGFQGTEQDLYNQLITLANGVLTGGSANDNIFDLGQDKFPGEWYIKPIIVEQKTLYQLYQDIGYNLDEQSFTDRAMTNIYGVMSGGSSNEDPTDLGKDKFEGDWEIIPNPGFTQKSLYELYKDINLNNPDILTEEEFNNKVNAYINTSLLPEIVEGGNSEGNIGNNEFSGSWDNKPIIINQKNLYQLFTDIGMNPDNIAEEEFNAKFVDLASKTDIPYSISGGPAKGDSWGFDSFPGSWDSETLTNSGIYQEMVKAGYKRDIHTLARQMNEIFTNPMDNETINPLVDGGSSLDGQDAGGSYSGPVPEARNAVLQCLIDNGFDPTPENIQAFNNRFVDFAEGELTNTLVDGGNS